MDGSRIGGGVFRSLLEPRARSLVHARGAPLMCRLHRVLANSRAADRAGFCFSSLAKIFSPLPSFSLYPRCGNFTLYTRSALSRLLACFCFCFVFLFFLLSFLFFFFCRYSCGWLLVAGNKRGVGKIANRRRSVQRRRRRRR